MKKQLSLLFMILLASLCTNAFAFEEDDGDEGVDINPVYHIFADVDLRPTSTVAYDKKRMVMKIIVPKITSGGVDENIRDFNRQVYKIIKDEKLAFKRAVDEQAEQQKDLKKPKLRNDLNMDFASSILSKGEDPIVSLRFSINGYITGMDKPYRYHRVLNYDLNSGHVISLKEMFTEDSDYLEKLSTLSRQILAKQVKDTSHIYEGTEPTIDNFKNWNLNPNGLRITFEPSQVAPAQYGTQTILIPYAELKDIIDDDSTIGRCINHKWGCLRSNILTGGFIDEAVNTKHSRFNKRLGKA